MVGDNLDFRLLFESSSEILLVLLPDAPRFTMVAATNSRLDATHTTRDATIGRGLFEVFPDNPNDPSATGTSNLRDSLERVIATKAPDTMAVQKYDIRGPDGSFQTKYWSPKNVPITSTDGDLLYIVHRVEDVTELVHASAEGAELRDRTQAMEREVVARSLELAAVVRDLREANTKLAQLDVAKTHFFNNVSHEFRTPLTLMLGPLDDALADPEQPLGRRQFHRIALARNNTLRLLKLVNTLLDFSRLEAGRLHAQFAALDVSKATIELAGMFQSAFDKAGIRYVVDCPPLSEPVWVDRDLWDKIVSNLISNAFKFTLTGQVSVTLGENADHVVLEVTDTGAGIPAAELPHIFERFYRVAGINARTYEGTGIGLALVRELVELHGGRISVESDIGQGSTFRVTLAKGFAHLPPGAVSQTTSETAIAGDSISYATEMMGWLPSDSAGNIHHDASPGPAAPHSCHGSVVVADDNPDLRAYVASLLSPTYRVFTAADGIAALDMVGTHLPDVVLTDVMMPHLDGLGLIRGIRADPRTRTIPVILLSARAGEESTIEGLDAGADDYLVKPFSARELLARVRTHLAQSLARRQWAGELERTNRLLESMNRDLEAFSYSVSHDLRAPLRHIVGFANLLESHAGAALDRQGARYLATIRDAAAHMSTLIDDLLAFSRMGQTPLHARGIRLGDIVRQAREDVAPATGERRVSWHIEPLPEAHGDPALLRPVFVNLLSNAVKYSSTRDEPRIEIGTLPSTNDEVTVYVRDNGVGFDMAHKDRLFGVFQRLHRADEFPGTGIGLANVKRIVERHGGRVWAESEPGRGATFYLSLPASEDVISPGDPHADAAPY